MYCDFPVLGRCCFCMPLRRGILTFGYINLVFSVLMIGIFSHALHAYDFDLVVYRGSMISLPSGVCIFLYCLDFVFNAILIYGAHKAHILHVRIYYYFSISTIAASFLIAIIELCTVEDSMALTGTLLEGLPVLLASKFLELYLIILVRSLLKKLNTSGPNACENPLHLTVYGDKVNTPDADDRDTVVVPVDV